MRIRFLLILLVLLSPFVFIKTVFAQELVKNETITLSKDQTVNKDYFATGEKIIISGTINGDTYLAGGNIIVDGTINGDLIAGGGSISVKGNVQNDARLGGGEIVVSGTIGGNVTTAGGSVQIHDSARINGSLTGGSGNMSIFGTVGKGATIGAGALTLGNTIGGDVQTAASNLTLLPQTKIAGDFTYLSKNDAQIQNGAQITGKTTHNFPKERQKETVDLAKTFSAFKFLSLISAFVIGFILLKLFPNFANQTANKIAKKPFSSFLMGILTLILIPIGFLILLITIIGIPIALILLAAFLVDIYIAKIFVALAIGKKAASLTKVKTGQTLTFSAGLVIFFLVSLIPILGWIFMILAIPAALGALVMSKREAYLQLRSKKLI